MSLLMQVFLNECGIVQLKPSPNRPQTNECCKRFHRMLKDMPKAMVESCPWTSDEICHRSGLLQGGSGAGPWVSCSDLVFGGNVEGMLHLTLGLMTILCLNCQVLI